MAKKGLDKVEANPVSEFHQIMKHIHNGDDFLLSGGAGSGKTYSLVEVIRQVIEENPSSRIACMTYTNSAVKEIEERVNHSNLTVSTIHDFLWDNIKHFQKELKRELILLCNEEEQTKFNIDEPTPIPFSYFDKIDIQYKEYLKLKEGIISHDELLLLSNRMFESYRILCDILKDKFKFIFIDEYQDTNKAVVDIFLIHSKKGKKKNVVGFFGDAMQSIYSDGIGNIDIYKGAVEGKVKEVKKEQNRRSPISVINLANILRTDGLQQVPSSDVHAPNMQPMGIIKEGSAKFIYSESNDIEIVRKYLKENYGWDFNNAKQTKELNLTHNLIAGKAGFKTLMEIYNRDRIIEYKGKLIKEIKEKKIEIGEGETFGEVIDKVNLTPSRLVKEFIEANSSLYSEARNYPFDIFRRIYLNGDILTDDKKQNKDEENKKGSKRDKLLRHLFKIQDNISLYINKEYNEFIRKTEFTINSINDKSQLKETIEEFIKVGEQTIEEIIDKAHETGLCIKDDNFTNFISSNEYIFNRVKDVKFIEFQSLYYYLEGYTPFSTQHKTKGSEFDNVLVILDNGKWNEYNFEILFLGGGTQTVLERTQKIFYVCCTRAKENLCVFYHSPKPSVVEIAKKWFGADNVVSV